MPIRVPTILPLPPASARPPSVTAAIQSISLPSPALHMEAVFWQVMMIPPIAAHSEEIMCAL